MATLLIYLVLAVVVAAVVYALARLVFGPDEELAPLPAVPTPTRLPEHGVTGSALREVRFGQVARGYRRSEVDWVLERTAAELDALRGDVRALRSRLAELERRR